jgi:hypothetical protein
VFFEIFRRIPTAIIAESREFPPWEMNGSVTPVVGNNPVATRMFRRA